MSVTYDKKTDRWHVFCDMPYCPSEYSCSGSFVRADKKFIKNELLKYGWHLIPSGRKIPKFACLFHKL